MNFPKLLKRVPQTWYVNIYIVFYESASLVAKSVLSQTENKPLAAILKGWQNSPGYFGSAQTGSLLKFHKINYCCVIGTLQTS